MDLIKNKNYFYDRLNSNGLIENDEQLLEDILKKKIIHLMIYVKGSD